MAKTARKNRKRNARRKVRELRATMRGDGHRAKARNPMVVALILRNGSGSHGDARKAASKSACRGTVHED